MPEPTQVDSNNGAAYRLTPAGQQFAAPISLTLADRPQYGAISNLSGSWSCPTFGVTSANWAFTTTR